LPRRSDTGTCERVIAFFGWRWFIAVMTVRGVGAPVSVACALVVSSCGGLLHESAPTTAEVMLARADEDAAARALPEYALSTVGGEVQLRVHGSAAPIMTPSGLGPATTSSFTIDLRGDETFCTVTSASLDVAHAFERLVASNGMTLLERPQVELDVAGGRPIVFFEVQGISENAQGRWLRHGVLAAAHLDQGSILCASGRFEIPTFRGFFRALVATAWTPRAPMPTFRSIVATRQGTHLLGFEYTRVYPGLRAGESSELVLSSELLSDGEQWSSADGLTVTRLDEDGLVSEQRRLAVGKMSAIDMKVTRTGRGTFAYQGDVLGKPKDGVFQSPAPIVTSLVSAASVSAFARGEIPTLSLATFDALTPTHPVAVRVEHERDGVVRFVHPGKTFHCAIDARGLCQRRWRDEDGWSAERIHSSGALEHRVLANPAPTVPPGPTG